MHILSVTQPWATLLSRGTVRFVVREDATNYRGTIAIHADGGVDPEAADRLASDDEFRERMAAEGFGDVGDFQALPQRAIVGVAVIADVWSLRALEEVATDEDALLIGDVVETAVFWELAEALEIPTIDDPPPVAEESGEPDVSAEIASGESEESDESDEPPEQPAARFEPLSDERAAVVQSAAQEAGARFDDDGLVFWPMTPTTSLAELIGGDAVGDREITRRVWAYVTEQDLQDPEDHANVFFDDALRVALDADVDVMTTVEFSDRIISQMRRIPDAQP